MKKNLAVLASALAFAAGGASLPAQTDSFGAWPAGRSPREIGKLVAEHFAASPHSNFNRKTPPAFITYPETCVWYGSLTFAKLSGDQALTDKLVKRFDPLFGPEADLIPKPLNVDMTVFATVPLELAIETKDPRYLKIGQDLADAQWDKPVETEHMDPADRKIHEDAEKVGLTSQTRLWIDDMYMITMVQTQAYRATGQAKYIDRQAREMAYYLDHLQQPNGLFFHAPDVPFFWGRGNGWFAAGMAETLRSLPADHPLRGRILEGYRKMMASLLKYQSPDGTWRQLIDHPESWPESSCTGMFTFAMVTGVKEGWLDAATYGPAARQGWLGLVSFINPNGDVREVCEGTNKKNDLQYYLDRGRNVGDNHGQAPVMWCASALLR